MTKEMWLEMGNMKKLDDILVLLRKWRRKEKIIKIYDKR